MSEMMMTLIIALGASLGSVGVFYFLSNKKKDTDNAPTTTSVDVSNEAVVQEANARAKELVVEAKGQVLKLKQDAQQEVSRIKSEVVESEKNIASQTADLSAREKQLAASKNSIEDSKNHVAKKREELDRLVKEQQDKLENIAGLNKKQARKELLESFDRELQQEKGKKVHDMEEEIKKTADEKAKEIIVFAIKQGATDYVV